MEQGLEPSVKQPCAQLTNVSVILSDRVIFSNVEASRASRNLEFGYSHPFPANARGTEFRERSQEALLAEVKDTLKKAYQTKKSWLSPSLALWDKFC